MSDIKILLVVPRKVTGCEYHRLLIPHYYLQGKGYDITQINIAEDQTDEWLQQFDFIYVSRVISQIGFSPEFAARLRRLGVKIVLDTDDHWQLHAAHILSREWKDKKKASIVAESIALADYVITTQEHLAGEVRKLNPNVFVIPNAIDLNQPQWKETDHKAMMQKGSTVNFGWSGSVTHHEDLLLLADAMYGLHKQEDLAGRYRILLSGYRPEGIWQQYEKILTSDGINPEGSYSRIYGQDVYSYGNHYDLFDVAIIPLRDNAFNRCKSNLKLLEAGAKRKAVIVSDVYPYNAHPELREIVKFVDNKAFYKPIIKLLNDRALRQDMGGRLYEWVKANYSIEVVSEKRDKIYRAITKQRHNGR